jgi:lipoprotein-releasing system permease protein
LAPSARSAASCSVSFARWTSTDVPWLEDTFHFKIMPGDVYYVTQIPSEVHLFDVVTIPAVAFLVALLATLYPARRAAAVAPAVALRYD